MPADVHERESSNRTKATPRRRRRPLLSITTRIDSRRYLAISTVAFVLFVMLWWGITAAEIVKPMFLPSPERVWQRLSALAAGGQLWDDLGISLFRISFSFFLACAMAIPLGMLIGSFRVLDAAFEPMIDFIRYMPVVAFVPLTILWVGTNEPQKYLIIWLGTFFQLTLMVQDCVKRVPRDFIDVGRTLEMREWTILQRIVLPSSAPAIWDAMRICLGWAWSWLVLAELVAASAGMGYRITVAQRYFQTDTIIGYVLVLGLLGLASDQLMKLLGKTMFRYQERT
ncbi:ABC transporter permease [Salinicola peritrichatus]|uniref:ABC transporter permease n=1 Tax=Salinicola peritrichatus TaxID=1267424 RepID=UPI000DA1334F|nr:ABC transporter permease [Salinicola peritrichatus]